MHTSMYVWSDKSQAPMNKMSPVSIAVTADFLAGDRSVYSLCTFTKIWRQITMTKAQAIQGQQQVLEMP